MNFALYCGFGAGGDGPPVIINLKVMDEFLAQNQWIIILAILWTLPWKGIALWKAAHNRHTGWFIALLIVNTLGILEILYIYIFNKKKSKEREPAMPQSME